MTEKLVVLLAACGVLVAQTESKNEIALSFGAAVTPGISAANGGGPITFETRPYFTPGFYHLLGAKGRIGVYGGVSIALSPNDVAVERGPASTYKEHAFAFLTPELLVKFNQRGRWNPWLSAGGGWSNFLVANTRLDGTGSGNHDSNSGVGVFGGGVDFRTPLRTPRLLLGKRVSFRIEVKNYLSGQPGYGVATSGSTQNYVLVGGGLLFHL